MHMKSPGTASFVHEVVVEHLPPQRPFFLRLLGNDEMPLPNFFKSNTNLLVFRENFDGPQNGHGERYLYHSFMCGEVFDVT